MAAPPEVVLGPRRGHRHRSGIVLPLILIVLGSVFLLQNIGILPPNAWLGLWRLWPLLLVLVGVDLLLPYQRPLAVLLGLLVGAIALGVLAGAVNLPGLSATRQAAPVTSRAQTQSLRGATQAAVTLRFGAGQLEVGPLSNAGPDDLGSLMYDGPSDAAPEVRYDVTNGTGRLNYQLTGRGGVPPFFNTRADSTLNVQLRPDLPLSLTVQTGATQARLDLSQLRVTALDMALGASDTSVRLPEAAGATTAHLSGGMSNLSIEVPEGVAAQIRARGGLSNFTVNQNRFPSVGSEMYRSSDYATAPNKVDITIETGFSNVRVN